MEKSKKVTGVVNKQMFYPPGILLVICVISPKSFGLLANAAFNFV